MMLVEVNMGKAAHSQPLLQLPVSAVLVLPEGRFLHRGNELHQSVENKVLRDGDNTAHRAESPRTLFTTTN